MLEKFLEKFMSRKGLTAAFWTISIIMVTALIYYTATLQKEVTPLPKTVKSESGEVLYKYQDIVDGKVFFNNSI